MWLTHPARSVSWTAVRVGFRPPAGSAPAASPKPPIDGESLMALAGGGFRHLARQVANARGSIITSGATMDRAGVLAGQDVASDP